jgi:6-methylsalicylate decarboxylase
MLLQRLDNQLSWEASETPEKASVAARRMWYVGHGHLSALRCTADSFGAGRLVPGIDFPYETGAVFKRGQLHHDQRAWPPATPTAWSR